MSRRAAGSPVDSPVRGGSTITVAPDRAPGPGGSRRCDRKLPRRCGARPRTRPANGAALRCRSAPLDAVAFDQRDARSRRRRPARARTVRRRRRDRAPALGGTQRDDVRDAAARAGSGCPGRTRGRRGAASRGDPGAAAAADARSTRRAGQPVADRAVETLRRQPAQAVGQRRERAPSIDARAAVPGGRRAGRRRRSPPARRQRGRRCPLAQRPFGRGDPRERRRQELSGRRRRRTARGCPRGRTRGGRRCACSRARIR